MCFLIAYQERFEEPIENEWNEHVKMLQSEVGGEASTIRRVWKEAAAGNISCVTHKKGAGRPKKLDKSNEGLKAAAFALNTGVPPTLATTICNEVNERALRQQGVTDEDELLASSVCRNTLMRTIKSFTDVCLTAVLRRKTGSKDPNGAWAQGRFQFASQMKEQFRLGEQINEGKIARADCADVQPLWMDGILQVDESHTTCTIAGQGNRGSCGNLQHRIAIDPSTGELKRVRDGGRMPKRRQRAQPKCDKEARGCFGVACPVINGVEKPTFMTPFDYAEKKMVSVKKANEKVATVNAQCSKWKGKGAKEWRPYNGTDEPFKERYGDNWLKEMKAVPKWKKVQDIRDMALHVIDEGNRTFKDSPRADDWMTHHDHLNILWEKNTVEWLKTLKCPTHWNPDRTWCDRFVKLEGSYSDAAPKLCKNKLHGDSPELMSLDCHLFSDVEEANARNIAFSFHLPEGHPMKHSASTPKRLWQSICRTIGSGKVPTAKRIHEDMYRIKDETLDRIIEAKGCYIEDSNGKKSRKGARGRLQSSYRREQKEKLSVLDDHLVEAMMHLHDNGKCKSSLFDLEEANVVSDDIDSEDEAILSGDDSDSDDSGDSDSENESENDED